MHIDTEILILAGIGLVCLIAIIVSQQFTYKEIKSEVESLRSAYEVGKDRKYKLMEAESRVKDLETFTQHLMDKRAKLLTLLRKNGISVTAEDFECGQQWGAKEYEHFKSKLK